MTTSALSPHIAAIWVVTQCRLQTQKILSQPQNKRFFCAARSLFSPLFELVLRHASAIDCYEKFQKLLINLHVMFARLSFIIWNMSSLLISNMMVGFSRHWLQCIELLDSAYIPSFIMFCPPWAILWLITVISGNGRLRRCYEPIWVLSPTRINCW